MAYPEDPWYSAKTVLDWMLYHHVFRRVHLAWFAPAFDTYKRTNLNGSPSSVVIKRKYVSEEVHGIAKDDLEAMVDTAPLNLFMCWPKVGAGLYRYGNASPFEAFSTQAFDYPSTPPPSPRQPYPAPAADSTWSNFTWPQGILYTMQPYEHRNHKGTDFVLFSSRSRLTDHSVPTVAVAGALLHGKDYAQAFVDYAFAYTASTIKGTATNMARSERV